MTQTEARPDAAKPQRQQPLSNAIDGASTEEPRMDGGLIDEADVLLQNFRPGAIDRMGFGEQEARKRNPGLIFVSISGFGENGPYANQRVYDPVIQALTGATDIQADRVTREPAMFRIIIADKVAALSAAQAVSSALYHRERSGEGQHIRLSMLDAMHWRVAGASPGPPRGRRAVAGSETAVGECAQDVHGGDEDHRWISV